MTRNHVLAAIKEGIQFQIKMADGEKCDLSDAHRIAVGRTMAVVVDKNDLPHILPLLTMTGTSYLKTKR